MSDELDEIVDNMKQSSAWIRILFMIGFAIASYFILLPLILVLSIAQALFTLITGNANANLRYFSASLQLYVSQLFNFMTYLCEVKPFPFSDLPEVEDDSLEEKPAPKPTNKKANGAAKDGVKDRVKASTESTAAPSPAAKKKAVTKKVAKKKVAKKKAPNKTAELIEKSGKDTGADDVSNS